MPVTVQSVTPILVVDRIEPSLEFWVERLGYELTAEVPHEGALGFVILSKDGTEIMYQTRASVASDVPELADLTGASALFIQVGDLEPVVRAVEGMQVVVPRRRTFYGMDEIGVLEPGGHAITFAQRVE